MSSESNSGDITLADLGIDLDELYNDADNSFTGLDTSCSGVSKNMTVDTKAMPNIWTISAKEALPQAGEKKVAEPFSGIIADLSEAGKKRKPQKDAKDGLGGWYGMQRQQPTPLEQAEIRAIQLRKFADPFSATRGNPKAIDSKIPQYFQFATEVGGGMRAVGEKTATMGSIDDTKKRGGRSLLEDMLNDSAVTEWATRKLNAVQETSNKRQKLSFEKKKRALSRQKKLNKHRK